MITIINPPNPPNVVSNKDTMGGLGQVYSSTGKNSLPPLDVPYAAALLKSRGIPVQVIDCMGLDWEISRLILFLQDQKSEFIVIRTSTPTYDWDMQVAQIIKKVIDTKIIVFGPHVTLYPLQTIQHFFIDAILLGEPEMALLDVAEHGFIDCEGVWYKKGNEIIQNGFRKPIDALDTLPFPAWALMPYRVYEGGALMRNLKPFVTVLTSRGCPHGCSYCPYPVIQGRKLRVRSPENVLDELEWLINTLGVKSVLFRDPEFALRRDRVVGICEGIIKRKLRLAWRCETRIEDLDINLIVLMAKAGCIGINTGIESTDSQVLHNLNRKPIPLEQTIKIVNTCKNHGIDPFCFFILGLPGDVKESVLKTIDYALKLNPAFVQFTVATPYPGTELRNWALSKGFIENQDFSAMTGYDAVMRNEQLSIEDIQWLQWFAQEAWEMQWRKVIRRLFYNTRQMASEIKRWILFQKANTLERC